MQFRFPLRTGLVLLVGTFLVALFSARLFNWLELRQVRVTGPIYNRILDSQGIMVDAMPPSMYASEAYIAVHQFLDAKDDDHRAACKLRFEQASQKYHDAIARWRKRIGPDELQATLGNSFKSGLQFLDQCESRLFPLAIAGEEHSRLVAIMQDELDPLFELHRSDITEGMQRASERFRADENLVLETTQTWWGRHLAFDLFWGGLLGLLVWRIGSRVMRLQSEKDRLLLVSNVSSTVFIISDREGNITWTNEGFHLRTGYQCSEVEHRSLVAYLVEHGIDAKAKQTIEQVLQTGNSCKLNITNHCREGRQFVAMMEMQPITNDQGKLNGFISILTDITLQATLHSRIASIFNSLTEGIVLQGLDGRIVDCNPAAEKLLGLSRKSILARTSNDKRWQAIHSDGSDWEGNTHPSMQTLRTGQPIHNAIMGLDFPNGERRWISINTEPVLGANGEMTAVVASFSDISRILAQKERLDMATRGAGLAIWEWHVEMDQLSIAGNEGPFPETTDQQSYRRAYWRSQIHPDDLTQAEKALESHLLGYAFDYRSEHRIKTPKGDWMWVLEAGRIVERSQGRPLRLAGIHLDITRSKLMEQQIRGSEMRTRMIINTAMDAVVCLDPQGLVTEWNAIAEKIFGVTLREAVGKPLRFFLADQVTASGHAFCLDSILRGEDTSLLGTRIEVLGVRNDGTKMSVELTINKLESKGETTYTAFLRDITEKKNLEMQLAQAQRLESIGQLAAGVAHEINTPVQFVNDSVHFLNDGFRDLISMVHELRNLSQQPYQSQEVMAIASKIQELEQQSDAEYLSSNMPKAIDRAIQGLNRISEIVRSMRDFSHPTTGPHAYVDVNRSLQSTLTVARTEYKYVAEVETDFGDIPNVLGNAGELNQVFLNLLINASHAIERKVGGSGKRGRILVSTRWEQERVVIRIQDDGCGIPFEIQHRIFEPFFTTKDVGKGTGQGLAIAYNIVHNKHGGLLEFESVLDEGTTFTIRLHRDGLEAEQGRSHSAGTEFGRNAGVLGS